MILKHRFVCQLWVRWCVGVAGFGWLLCEKRVILVKDTERRVWMSRSQIPEHPGYDGWTRIVLGF